MRNPVSEAGINGAGTCNHIPQYLWGVITEPCVPEEDTKIRNSRQAVITNLETFFNTADKDSDGYLTIEELTQALRKEGYPGTENEIRRFFQLADQDAKDQVSFDDYIRVMGDAPLKVHSKAAMRKVFAKFDVDGNGKIDKTELKQVFESMGKFFPESDIAQMIDSADIDQSGALEYEEFIEVVLGEKT